MNRFARTALSSHLTHAAVLASRCDQCGAFIDVVANRLFNICVFTSLHCPDARQSMPVIGRGRADHVDGTVFECFSHVDDWLWSNSLLLFDLVAALVRHRFISIDDDANLRSIIIEIRTDVLTATTIHTDHSYAHLFVWAQARSQNGRGCEDCRGSSAGLQKSSTIQGLMDFSGVGLGGWKLLEGISKASLSLQETAH